MGYRRTEAERSAEVEMYTKRLEEGIQNIRSSAEYQEFLDYASRFHGYSLSNTMLIMMQCENASQVAGFAAWKKMGRYVKKGEKAIKIFAPLHHKVIEEDANGNEVEYTRLHGFRLVNVFDVSQTDGMPLPENPLQFSISEDEVEGLDSLVSAITSVASYPVEYSSISEKDVSGYCNHQAKKITISSDLKGVGKVNVLLHETAHSLLHAGSKLSSQEKEVEAESVAYIVSRYLGIDTSEASFGYVASWAASMNDDEYKERIKAILGVAHQIIDHIDTSLALVA